MFECFILAHTRSTTFSREHLELVTLELSYDVSSFYSSLTTVVSVPYLQIDTFYDRNTTYSVIIYSPLLSTLDNDYLPVGVLYDIIVSTGSRTLSQQSES
jgi:hypothetical protein